MPEVLKVKQFGLPRWVWIAALTGGVAVGLYIRSRQTEGEPVDESEYTEDELAMAEGEAYNGTDGLPVGFYDAVSGAGEYLPDAAGEAVTEPIINIYTGSDDGTGDNTGGSVIPKPKKPKISRVPKSGPGPKSGRKRKPRPPTGGGPPKRPKPKVKARPPKKAAGKKPPKKAGTDKAKSQAKQPQYYNPFKKQPRRQKAGKR